VTIALAAAALKLLPVAVVSIDKLLIARDPSAPALKSVTLSFKVPSAAIVAAVDEPTAERAALPQGLAVEGLWTSLRTGVPLTPRELISAKPRRLNPDAP